MTNNDIVMNDIVIDTGNYWLPGFLADCCWSAHLDGRTRGYAAGYVQALADEDAATWSACTEVVHNIVRDRSRTWATSGEPQRKGMSR